MKKPPPQKKTENGVHISAYTNMSFLKYGLCGAWNHAILISISINFFFIFIAQNYF